GVRHRAGCGRRQRSPSGVGGRNCSLLTFKTGRRAVLIVRGLFYGALVATAMAPTAEAQASPSHVCRFVKIPMRDGIQLNTSICEPQGQHQPLPFLMTRTPYGIAGDTVVP